MNDKKISGKWRQQKYLHAVIKKAPARPAGQPDAFVLHFLAVILGKFSLAIKSISFYFHAVGEKFNGR